jgi:hypothetical protein
VLDPLGFRGRTFEAAVALTFVVRELAGAIRTAVGKRSFFFTELGKTELMALHKIEDAPVQFVSFEGSEPQFYTLRESSQGFEFVRGKASWPSDAALKILEARFDVSREVAEKIFATYLAREMSLHAQRALDRAFSPAIDAFFGTLVRERMGGRVYVSEEGHLPFFLPRSKGKTHLIAPPLHAVLGRHALGIVMSEWAVGEGLLFSRLAPFLEYFGDKNDHRAEHWLNRLFKWKIPTVS